MNIEQLKNVPKEDRQQVLLGELLALLVSIKCRLDDYVEGRDRAHTLLNVGTHVDAFIDLKSAFNDDLIQAAVIRARHCGCEACQDLIRDHCGSDTSTHSGSI